MALKLFLKWIFTVHDLALGLCCLLFMGYGAFWLTLPPLHQPFGLAILSDYSNGKNGVQGEAKNKTESLTLSAVSEDDIMATEWDENNGKIEELSPSIIDYILKDRGHRISDVFSVSADLQKRVEFWFKIYATYTISNAVIHDMTHPWIIYEIINLNTIYDKQRSGTQRNALKSKMIRNTRYHYLHALDKLSKRTHYHGLSPLEQRIYNLFQDIEGPRQKVFSKAKRNIRVQLGQKDSVIYAIKKSGRYLKSMEKIFVNNNLPVELTRIPFLESSFNLDAYSKDGASGVWQFMHKTGKAFLKISHAAGIDERNHPLKATKAATQLLKQNFQILKNWPLAVTAYNHGPGGILKGIQKIGSRNLNDLIEYYHHPYFSFASKNFYSEFLAMLHVERYQDKIFGYVKKDERLVHDDIEIKYAMRVKFIMDLCGITKEEIRIYNPDLRQKALDSRTYLPEGYYLKLPSGKKKALIDFYKEVEETNKLLDQMLGTS